MTKDIRDRILDAISNYVQKNGSAQSKIILSRCDYKELHRIAKNTTLGRNFLKSGFCFCTLPVFSYSGQDIVIA